MNVTRKAWRTTETGMEMTASKKRKLYSELENEGDCGGEVETATENSASPVTSRTSGCCYEHEECSGDVVKKGSSDLENVDSQSEGFGTEICTSIARVFRESTPTSEFYGDSEQVLLPPASTAKTEKSTPPAIFRQKILEHSPQAAELEDFFAAAEKSDQKRFVEKYNYDIVRDVPLEGKYQWVRLLP